MTQLSPNFTLEELTTTNTGISNIPTAQEIELLKTLAAFLEKVRAVLGHPIHIDSAFRSQAVNIAVGGVPTSAHRECFAGDILCPGFGTPWQVALALDQAIKDGKIACDQLIYEQTWVHISRDPRLRGERLTHWDDGTYAAGLHSGPHS